MFFQRQRSLVVQRTRSPVLTTMGTVGLCRGQYKVTVQVQLALGCRSNFIGVVFCKGLPLLLFGLVFLTFHMYCESSLGLFPSKRK